jgi:hypothetical protein
MTAITAPRTVAGTTSFERTLLRAASALDQFVLHRLERRSAPDARSAAAARSVVASARDAAEAHAAMGMMPR